ncbi:hypothetical protein, partial [Bacteroides thetaiotaomicron]|uniref:hypothetical protein n=1 Tax=Bacteroides thetaiotaomicron TaxID=818 RepID=UPI0039B413D6
MVHAVQKRLNINNHISIAAIDYIKKLFVYAFIVIRHVLSKCFACSAMLSTHSGREYDFPFRFPVSVP